jgi:hypothetical protein
MRRRYLVRFAVLVTLAALPAGALAATPAAKLAKTNQPAEPKGGAWKIVTNGYVEQLSGSFTVTSQHYVTAFTGTIASGAETACGTGTVTVVGKQKIIDAKGTDPEGDAYNEYAVGRNDPSADPTIQPVKVTVNDAGTTIPGKLTLVFASAAARKAGGISGGELDYDAGACELAFGAKQG